MVFWLCRKPWGSELRDGGLFRQSGETFMCTFLHVGLHVSIHSCKELFKTASQVWSCGTSCSLNRSRHRDYLHNEFTTLLPARACWRWYTEIDLRVCEWVSVRETERERKNPESFCIDGLVKGSIPPHNTTTRAFYYCEAKMLNICFRICCFSLTFMTGNGEFEVGRLLR